MTRNQELGKSLAKKCSLYSSLLKIRISKISKRPLSRIVNRNSKIKSCKALKLNQVCRNKGKNFDDSMEKIIQQSN